MPGFPSYCTDALLDMPPSSTELVWLSIGLRAILDAYPPIPPKQVTVSCVHLTSYGFLQTPPLASDALAIRIIFPLVRVISPSYKWTGLPALLGKQKSRYHHWYRLILIWRLAMPYSHMGKPHTTIGVITFHYWVRNGIRWYRNTMVTKQIWFAFYRSFHFVLIWKAINKEVFKT